MNWQSDRQTDREWKHNLLFRSNKHHLMEHINHNPTEGEIFTSLAKEVMFLVALVCLSVCLFVCEQHYSKSYERIGMKFYGRVLSSTMKN